MEIDEKSLAALGQWPWPRTQLADLVDAIARQHPAAIGIDILMPEADPLSAERLLERARKDDPLLAARLELQPSNDNRARALGRRGADRAGDRWARPSQAACPCARRRSAIADASSAAPWRQRRPRSRCAQFEDVLTSLDEIDRAAAGHGLISVEPPGRCDSARCRWWPDIHGTLVPALSIEMLRVAPCAVAASPARFRPRRVEAVAIGDFIVPTEDDGVGAASTIRRATRALRLGASTCSQGKVDPQPLRRTSWC